jgi:protein-tyrosine phosphatase
MKQYNKAPSVLVVCMGNICRSPTGEAVLRAKAEALNIPLEVDSAGTIAYHTGDNPDSRSRAAGEARGYNFSTIRARQVTQSDFAEFDYILCADKANLRDLMAICPSEYQAKLALFLSFGSDDCTDEIPDPYYGGEQGFEHVIDLIEDASDGFLKQL